MRIDALILLEPRIRLVKDDFDKILERAVLEQDHGSLGGAVAHDEVVVQLLLARILEESCILQVVERDGRFGEVVAGEVGVFPAGRDHSNVNIRRPCEQKWFFASIALCMWYVHELGLLRVNHELSAEEDAHSSDDIFRVACVGERRGHFVIYRT